MNTKVYVDWHDGVEPVYAGTLEETPENVAAHIRQMHEYHRVGVITGVEVYGNEVVVCVEKRIFLSTLNLAKVTP